MEVVERIWRKPHRSYYRVLPGLLGITHRGYSMQLQRAMTDFGMDHSFAAAAGKIREHYGIDVAVSSLRKHSEWHAQRIATESSSVHASANSLPEQGADKLVAETDGSMVAVVSFDPRSPDKRKSRKVEYKEVRLCACQVLGEQNTHYHAKIASPEQIGQVWNACAKESGRGLNSFVHAVGDGAPWIRQQAQSELRADRVLLDFFHACEYLKDAEDTCATNSRWFATQKNRLKRNRSDLVIEELHCHIEASGLPDPEAPVRCAHRYLSNRIEMLDYKQSIVQGLPIGSGLIESGHKHVIQARMKIAGAAWNIENADAICQTRARRASGKWQCFWQN